MGRSQRGCRRAVRRAAALAHEAVLNADETGHRTNGEKRWLWTLVACTFVFFTIARSRGSDVLEGLLGPTFAGVLGSDRLPAYLRYAADRRQFCWAHYADLPIMPISMRDTRLAAVPGTRMSA